MPTLTEDLLGLVRERSPQIEAAGRVAPDVLDALQDAGCLRMAVPAAYGGADLALPAALDVVERIARADASVGWTVGQIALSQIMLGYLPPAALDEVYGDGPDVRCAGAAAPKGRASRTRDGWRVRGQWPLVSGSVDADWIFLQCLAVEDGAIAVGPGGVPRMRMAVLPAAEVTIVQTWDAIGLRGTASHDVLARDAPCPDGWSVELAAATPTGSIARIPPPAQGGLFVGAVATGVAAAALATLEGVVTGGKRPAFSPRRLADSPLLHNELGAARLALATARALLRGEVARADAQAADGLDALGIARLRASSVKVVELATHVVDRAYTLAGATSAYVRSPLQRHLRDVHTATQHFTAGRAFYGPLGALLCGGEADQALA